MYQSHELRKTHYDRGLAGADGLRPEGQKLTVSGFRARRNWHTAQDPFLILVESGYLARTSEASSQRSILSSKISSKPRSSRR